MVGRVCRGAGPATAQHTGLSPHSTSDLCSFLNKGAIGSCFATRDKFTAESRLGKRSQVLSCHSQKVCGELLEVPLLPPPTFLTPKEITACNGT